MLKLKCATNHEVLAENGCVSVTLVQPPSRTSASNTRGGNCQVLEPAPATQVTATLCEILAGSPTSATTLLHGVVAGAQAIGHGKEAKPGEHAEESPAPGQHAAGAQLGTGLLRSTGVLHAERNSTVSVPRW